MKTGDEVFERSTGAKGRIVSTHGDNVYVVFKNGRKATVSKSDVMLTFEQSTENACVWVRGTGKKIQETVEESIILFMELPLYSVVTISTILLFLGAGIAFLLSMF